MKRIAGGLLGGATGAAGTFFMIEFIGAVFFPGPDGLLIGICGLALLPIITIVGIGIGVILVKDR